MARPGRSGGWRGPAGSLAALLGSVALAAGLIEATLRLTDNPYRDAWRAERDNRTTVRYRAHAGSLHRLVPGTEIRYQGACFDIQGIGVNARGFRDRPWPEEADRRARVLLLGDSFIEALQVTDAAHIATRLGQAGGARFVAAGISGYATLSEYATYRDLAPRLRPDVVVLFFYVGNDVLGNSCALGGPPGLCGEVVDGAVRLRGLDTPEPDPAKSATDPGRAAPSPVVRSLRRHLVTAFLLDQATVIGRGLLGLAGGAMPTRFGLYRDPAPKAWDDAWAVTGEVLRRLRDAVAADGARLAVVVVPEHFVTSPDWRSEIRFGAGTALAADFDPDRPHRRMADLLVDLGLPSVDLREAFRAYVAGHRLAAPYLSHRCDGHWNALGHHVAAVEVSRLLNRSDLLGNRMPVLEELPPEAVLADRPGRP